MAENKLYALTGSQVRLIKDALDWIKMYKPPQSGRATPPAYFREPYLAIIQAAGPAAEADYTDERYWIRRAFPTNTAPSGTGENNEIALAELAATDNRYGWTTATNLAELEAGTHTLAAGTVVDVLEIWDSARPSCRHYYFSQGGVASALFAVKVWKTFGSAGSSTTQCSYVYTVKTLDAATTLGTGMTPALNRPTTGPLNPPTDGAYGLGFYNGDTFVLYDANESLDTDACA